MTAQSSIQGSRAPQRFQSVTVDGLSGRSPRLRIEHADLSLIGDREDNQDRVAVAANDNATLLIVIDGMGGHSDGSRAADTALKSLLDSFHQTPAPLFDPLGFLHMALSRAHDEVAALGSAQIIDARPRATTAVCLVHEGAAYWAHIGGFVAGVVLIKLFARRDYVAEHKARHWRPRHLGFRTSRGF